MRLGKATLVRHGDPVFHNLIKPLPGDDIVSPPYHGIGKIALLIVKPGFVKPGRQCVFFIGYRLLRSYAIREHHPEDDDNVSDMAWKWQLLFDIRRVGGRELIRDVCILIAVLGETGREAM